MNITDNEGVIYTRVSSDKQVREGHGLETQLFYCQKLATNVFFSNPKQYWLKGTASEKKVLFGFIFDETIEITDGKVGTAPYSLPYRLLSKPVVEKESMVELGGIEPPTSCVPRRRSPS